jgi:hypothetical protein
MQWKLKMIPKVSNSWILCRAFQWGRSSGVTEQADDMALWISQQDYDIIRKTMNDGLVLLRAISKWRRE